MFEQLTVYISQINDHFLDKFTYLNNNYDIVL